MWFDFAGPIVHFEFDFFTEFEILSIRGEGGGLAIDWTDTNIGFLSDRILILDLLDSYRTLTLIDEIGQSESQGLNGSRFFGAIFLLFFSLFFFFFF